MTKDRFPRFGQRIYAVWWRHLRVYSSSLFSNAAPPFAEPLIFLLGIGLGLGQYIVSMDGIPYIQFLAIGLVLTSSMYTASFENTFGTFIRLEFDKVYDGMLASSITTRDLIWGEILFSATKGAFFAFAVLIVVSCFSLAPHVAVWAGVGLGFLTAAMFAVLGILVTSFVRNINHFNFYFTLFISPLFFFSGVVFPLSQLPPSLQVAAWVLPLTHPVSLMQALAFQKWDWIHLWNGLYIAAFIPIVGALAVWRMHKRLVN